MRVGRVCSAVLAVTRHVVIFKRLGSKPVMQTSREVRSAAAAVSVKGPLSAGTTNCRGNVLPFCPSNETTSKVITGTEARTKNGLPKVQLRSRSVRGTQYFCCPLVNGAWSPSKSGEVGRCGRKLCFWKSFGRKQSRNRLRTVTYGLGSWCY